MAFIMWFVFSGSVVYRRLNDDLESIDIGTCINSKALWKNFHKGDIKYHGKPSRAAGNLVYIMVKTAVVYANIATYRFLH